MLMLICFVGRLVASRSIILSLANVNVFVGSLVKIINSVNLTLDRLF